MLRNGRAITIFTQVLPFPSPNVSFAHFCCENGIYALWWAGLARYKSTVGRLDNSGARGTDDECSKEFIEIQLPLISRFWPVSVTLWGTCSNRQCLQVEGAGLKPTWSVALLQCL